MLLIGDSFLLRVSYYKSGCTKVLVNSLQSGEQWEEISLDRGLVYDCMFCYIKPEYRTSAYKGILKYFTLIPNKEGSLYKINFKDFIVMTTSQFLLMSLKNAGISIKELLECTGYSRMTINRIITHNFRVSIDVGLTLSKVLHFNPDVLFKTQYNYEKFNYFCNKEVVS